MSDRAELVEAPFDELRVNGTKGNTPMSDTIRLLYIEDDTVDQKSFVKYIRTNKLSYELFLASSLAEGSQKTKENKFDLIVADYNLPDGTGLDIVKQVNKIPIIILTGEGEEIVAGKALKHGIADYVIKNTKGTHWESLVSSINGILQSRVVSNGEIKILIVEDDKLDQKAIARALDAHPQYRQTFAGTIKEAKEKLEETQFNLAFLDASLPDGTSAELFPLFKNIPFIVVTGAGSEEFAIRAYHEGAADYLIKDVDNFYLKLIPWTIAKTMKQREIQNLKEGFISTVSHEMRTPLAILDAGLANFKDGLYGKLTELQNKAIQTVYNNSKRLARIINDILDLSRLESGRGRTNRTMISIHEIVQKIINECVEAKANRVCLRMEAFKDLPKIWGDEEMIERLLTNLLSNACRFAKREVIVKGGVLGEGIQISVIDDGAGIPAEEQSRLFNKFEQLHRPKGGAGYKGTGLGLAICKEIVNLHEGQIGVESSEGSGARFWFILPKDLRKESKG